MTITGRHRAGFAPPHVYPYQALLLLLRLRIYKQIIHITSVVKCINSYERLLYQYFSTKNNKTKVLKSTWFVRDVRPLHAQKDEKEREDYLVKTQS